MNQTCLIENIGCLAGINERNLNRYVGTEMKSLTTIENAYILIKDGKIDSYGSMSSLSPNTYPTIDAHGGTVLPAWCDSHTHIVYHQSREQEFVQRIKGVAYEEIARQGGGILNSALRLQKASAEELYDQAWMRLQEVIQYGTGAIEIKSGYGLTEASELMMLRTIKKLKEKSPIPIKASFLGAHAIPTEYKNNRKDYINLLVNKLLPQIADEGLADYMDVFCDRGFYTVDETAQLLDAGWKYGLRPKIHANELDNSGGVQVGVKYNALSVDHLECVGNDEINALMGSDTMPTLLPSTAFFLNLEYAPARKMIDAGLPIALASDYNPGSTPSGRIPFVLSLACLKMKMLPEEAINACTMNSAYAMDLSKDYGSITVGKVANLIITKPISSLAFIPYSFGSDLISQVILNGQKN